MNQDKTTYDWMLVTVRGYDKEKGYVYGNRHPDGKGVIVAKKHNVTRDWVKSLSNEKERTFTPPQSVIAVYGAEEKDEKSGFTIASWATPISKDLGQEDVYVTPIKVSPHPKQLRNQTSGKSTYIDAVVLDQRPIEVRTAQDIRDTALSILSNRSGTELRLEGNRGFMIRIGHTAPDGSLGAHSWEFFGRSDNSPDQTWNYYWNQKAKPDRQKNMLQAVLTAAQSAFKDPNAYVEIVGCTRVLINDFGDPKRVQSLADLPNYKTTDKQNRTVASYALAAITVEKQSSKRIIKNQIPLPRNKIINHIAGVLGNHVPGIRMPVAIKPISETPQQATPKSHETEALSQSTIHPLTIKDHVNGDGEVKSFRVYGSKESLDKYKNEIESSAKNISPFRVRGELAYSFPIRYKKEVEASLSHLTGNSPLYIQQINTNQGRFLAISGDTENPVYKDKVAGILTRLNAANVHGQLLIPEANRAQLVAELSSIQRSTTATSNTLRTSPSTRPTESPRALSNSAPSNDLPARMSFSEWQHSKFRKDPYAMMDSLDGYIADFAAQAGIDWSSARDAIDFGGANQKGKLVKSSTVRPIDKAHRGSVAMAAHVKEKSGSSSSNDPNDSIVWFKINFFNKKSLKDEVITFDAFPYLKDEYERDVKNGVLPNRSEKELEDIKKKNEARKAKAREDAEKQALRDERSRNYWARTIPTMPIEDGTNKYFQTKGIQHIVPLLDARSGQDQNGRYSIIAVHDMNTHFTGAQRIYENYWTDEKGKKTNKNFIPGTLFKDDVTDLPYGTHKLIGNVDPAKPIIFCEGVADSGTDHAATGLPVAICLNKGNLYHVVGLYRQKYPNTRLIIASDNDFYDIRKGNVGFAATLDAARDHGAEYTVPSFKGLNIESKPTDFNDLEKLAGMDVVRNQFRNIRVPPADILEFHKLKTQVVGLDKLNAYLDVATAEIVSQGNHGVDPNRIRALLVNEAVSAYGIENLSAYIKDDLTGVDSANNQSISSNNDSDLKYPVTIHEHEGVSGKKSCIVIDHKGDNAKAIETALKKIVGDRHLPFNSHLGGWVAPFPVMRLLNTYLHNLTGAPQLYIGQSRGKETGTQFVVRGDFTDKDFLKKIVKSIQYAQPSYKSSQFGLVIPDAKAMPYIRETLRPYLTSNIDLQISVKQPETPEPQLNDRIIDEAVRLSGQSRGEVILAHIALQFQDSSNIFLDDDYAFSAVYSRVSKSMSHLEPDVRHEKSLAESCTSIRSMLKSGIADNVVSSETIQRLNELVTHLEFTLERAPIDGYTELSNSERIAVESTAEKLDIDIDEIVPIILGNASESHSDRDEILSLYQKNLLELVDEASVEEVATQSIEQDEIDRDDNFDANTAKGIDDVNTGSPQHDRVIKLLEITHLAVDKGFDEEDLYDIFITQPGSPYFNSETNSFNDIQYRQDLKYLSGETNIPGWQNTSVNSTSQLFYAIYGDVARDRIAKLEDYIDSYFGANGVTHWKTFEKYFSGKQSFAGQLDNPYLLEDEVDYELISKDLEYLTSYTSMHEFYRGVSEAFEQSQVDSDQQDFFDADKQDTKALTFEVVAESAKDNLRGLIRGYNIEGNNVYEILVEKDNKGVNERIYHDFNIYKDISLHRLQHALENSGLDESSYENGSRGTVSVSVVASEEGSTSVLQNVEIDMGPVSFFQIRELERQLGLEVISNVGVFQTYQEAAEAYQKHYADHIGKYSKPSTTEDVEPVVQPKTADASARHIGELLKEHARRGESFTTAAKTVNDALGISLSGSSYESVRAQYDLLVKKIATEIELKSTPPQHRYGELQDVTLKLAKAELTYDEYVDEFFRVDGNLVEDNPYWDSKTDTVDRHGAYLDIRAAGYQSLSHFYESTFERIHNRTSSQLVLGRVGGYIPNVFDSEQPLRPQFENINKLFVNQSQGDSTRLPPFNDWVTSLDAYAISHPILLEDIGESSSSNLSSRYDRDSLMMLADVYGVAVNGDSSKDELADKIVKTWTIRSQLSSLTPSEIANLPESEITQALLDLNTSSGGSKREKENRLVAHLTDLRSISKLRIAQYSYICTAMKLESKGQPIPNYALRAISQFISNESEFLSSASKAVELADEAHLRNNIEASIKLVSEIPPMERSVLQALPDEKAEIVGIDKSKRSALIFSENYDEDDKSAARYRYRYASLSAHSGDDIVLPPHISHYARYPSKVIATPVPIDSTHLLANNMSPISSLAIQSVLAPLERWMDKFGYAGLIDSDGQPLIALNNDNSWELRKIENGKSNLVGTYKTPRDVLIGVSGGLSGFMDRDTSIEASLALNLDGATDIVDKLKNLLLEPSSVDEHLMQQLLNNEKVSQLIIGHVDEDDSIKLELAVDYLIKEIKNEYWEAVASGKPRSSEIIDIANHFIATFDQKNENENDYAAPSKPLYLLTPMEVTGLVDAIAESDLNDTSSDVVRAYIEHYQSLSTSQKHLLSTDIATGTYESVGHFIHECEVKKAVELGIEGATAIARSYYPELDADDVDKPVEPDSHDGERLLLITSQDRGNYAIGYVADENDQKITIQEIDFNQIGSDQLQKPTNSEGLIGQNGEYLPSLSLDQFRKLAEAYKPPTKYLDIDPRTQAGQDELVKLPKNELVDYAVVFGANHKGNRVDIINSIFDIVNAKEIISRGITDIASDLSASEKEVLHRVIGQFEKERQPLNFLNTWLTQNSVNIANEISLRNYTSLQSEATARLHSEGIYNYIGETTFDKQHIEIYPLQNVQGLTDVDNISSLKDIAGYLSDNEVLPRGFALLRRLNLTSRQLQEIIAATPPNVIVKPETTQTGIRWNILDSESLLTSSSHSSLSDLVRSLKDLSQEQGTFFGEGEMVAWMDDGVVKTAHVAMDTKLSQHERLPVTFTDESGRNYVQELDRFQFIAVPEDQFRKDYNQITTGFSGSPTELIAYFEKRLENVPRDDSRAVIKSQLLIDLAKSEAADIDRSISLLPEGYTIHLESNKYSLKSINEKEHNYLRTSDNFDSLDELTRNVAIQQRNLINEDNHDGIQRINSDSTQPMGSNSQKPPRVDAPSENEATAGEQRLASNVVNLTKPNRERDGGDDEPPHDPTPGPGGSGISGKGNTPSTDTSTGPRDSIGRSSPRTRGVSFQLDTNLEKEVSAGPNVRKQLNLDALKLREELLETGRTITNEDKTRLSRYTGWGGLSSIFSQYGYDRVKSDLINCLRPGEYDQIKRSVLTAFYTPPSVTSAMWDAVKHIGFRGGKVLDPSTGTGQFIGAAPIEIAENSSFVARELDPVAGSLAQMIYGQEMVQLEAYEKAKLPNNYFDLAISNIPFGEVRVFDSEYKNQSSRIHDYFFSKSLDKVRPGGVVAFITSTGTLDKKDPTVREHLYEKADLLGAIRLPRKTFSDYAGTDVNADIVFLQKRPPNAQPRDNSWVWAIEQEYEIPGSEEKVSLAINRYFLDNPGMIIGEASAISGRFGPELVTAYSGDNTIAQEIRSRIEKLPGNQLTVQSHREDIRDESTIAINGNESLKPGNFALQNGVVGVVNPEFTASIGKYENKFVPLKLGNDERNKLRSMIEIRDLTKATINLQLREYSQSELDDIQHRLNLAYDNFHRDYGPLNSTKNRRLFSPDPDAPLLLALEKPGDKKGEYSKTDIFSEATIRRNLIPSHAESAEEALQVSLGVKGRIDTTYISELVGQPWVDVVSQLDGNIYLDPKTNLWQTKEQYLSGNIGNKLEYAKEAAAIDAQFERNVVALNKVMPSPIPSYDIKVRLGATWIPVDDISRFVAHIVRGDDSIRDPQEKYSVSQFGGNWVVRADSWELSINEGRAYQEWGTKRLSAVDLVEKLLNNRQIIVRDKLDDGSTVVNRDETIAANQKADALNAEFRQWIWSDSERHKRLEELYNRRYNVFVEPKYSGESVRLDGISPTLKGRPLEARDSQKAAIQRYIFEGRTLNAHPVGAGKTLELVGSAMEGKRLGIHSKPLIVVPNNILSQFGRMALELYPAANALVIDPKQLSKNARKEFTAKIATSDWDMVVIAQSSFDKIATPPEHQKSVIDHEKFKLEEALQELSGTDNYAAKLTVKRLERSLDNLEKKIEELVDSDKKDNFLYLNEIGVDALMVDEADNYLNLFTPTQMSHVPGVNTSSSQRAMNMLMAVRYIQELNNDYRGVIFATGTDIRNSMSDMYTMLRYLAPDVLEASQSESFDAFMGTFGEVVKTVEVNPEGTGYRENSRLSKFTNIPEMVMMYRQVADVLTDAQLKLPKPKVDEINIAAESGEWLRMYMAHLAERAKATRSGGVDNRDDNLLKIANDGRKASLDMRLIDERIPDDPKSKVNRCVENVVNEWKNGASDRLTQIVFCDMGVPKKDRFSVYEDIKEKLVREGIPEREIAFAQDYKTDLKKKQLESELNSGDIRVVIASTETLGVGSNVQERLVAQHNLDAPWRPRDLEQRGGRMERPGNTNEETRRYNYTQADSFDLFMWETLKRKAAFIQQAKVDPRSAAREIDEDLNPTYSEVMAITTGNPLIRKKIEIDSTVEKLQSAERSHKRAQWDNTNQIAGHNSKISSLEQYIAKTLSLVKSMQENNGEVRIEGRTYTDINALSKTINRMLKEFTDGSSYKGSNHLPLGTIGTTPFFLQHRMMDGSWALRVGDDSHQREVSSLKSMKSKVEALFSFERELLGDVKRAEREISRHESAIESLQEVASKPFTHQEELIRALDIQKQLNIELSETANEEIDKNHQNQERFVDALEAIPQHAVRMRVG